MKSTIEYLSNAIKVDLLSLINRYTTFIINNYQNIVEYYEINKRINTNVFVELDRLLIELSNTIQLLSNKTNIFRYAEDIDFFSDIQDMEQKLLILKNIYKYTKTDKSLINKNGGIEIDTKPQNYKEIPIHLLEYNYSDLNKDWFDVLLSNSITEKDYTKTAPPTYKVNISQRNPLDIQTTAGSLIDENAYGKDISKEFYFENDDLKSLGNQDTLKQSIEILLSFKKGDCLEKYFTGFDKGVLLGVNKNLFQFPILLRQLGEVLSLDDNILSFKLKNTELIEDSYFLEIEIITKLNEIKSFKLNLA